MKISKFNFNFHKRLITILTILLSISSCFQLIALLTVPVTNKLTLCKFDGYEFGVFGVCKDGSCTHVGIGYKPDERIGYGPSQQSENYEFSLPSNARHSISYLLVVHPIATGFNIIELLLVVSLFNQNLSNSTNYLLAILLFMLPTFLLTLLSFLVDILLFLPHLQWCGWTLLGSTVLIAVSGTILCIMRRTVSSRKSHWQNLRNTGNDLYSLNLLYDDSNESSDDYNYDRYSSSLTSSNLQELNLISTKNNNSYHNSSSTYSNNINNNNNNNNNNSNNNNNNNNNNTNTHIIQQNPFEIDQVADNSEEKLDNLVLRNKIIGDSGTVVIKRKPISDHNINSHESPIHELKFTYPTKSQPPFTTNNASSYPDMTYPNNTNNNNNDIDEEELLIKPGRSRRIQSPKRLRSPDYSPPKIISNPIRSMFDFNDEINETQSEPIAQLDSTNLNRFKSFKSEHTSSIFMDLNDLKNEQILTVLNL
ncbi:unnamed protein product [[Candida] boidinii]|nr:unnamed protein product [[Candida] boidinii]